MLPPGLSFNAVSQKALAASRRRSCRAPTGIGRTCGEQRAGTSRTRRPRPLYGLARGDRHAARGRSRQRLARHSVSPRRHAGPFVDGVSRQWCRDPRSHSPAGDGYRRCPRATMRMPSASWFWKTSTCRSAPASTSWPARRSASATSATPTSSPCSARSRVWRWVWNSLACRTRRAALPRQWPIFRKRCGPRPPRRLEHGPVQRYSEAPLNSVSGFDRRGFDAGFWDVRRARVAGRGELYLAALAEPHVLGDDATLDLGIGRRAVNAAEAANVALAGRTQRRRDLGRKFDFLSERDRACVHGVAAWPATTAPARSSRATTRPTSPTRSGSRYLGVHAYSPRGYRSMRKDAEWNALRYRKIHDALERAGIRGKRMVITESGLGDGWRGALRRRGDGRRLRLVHPRAAKDPYMIGQAASASSATTTGGERSTCARDGHPRAHGGLHWGGPATARGPTQPAASGPASTRSGACSRRCRA